MSGTRAVRVPGRIALAGVLAVVAAVVLLMLAPLLWRQLIESATTYQDLLDLMGLSDAVGDALGLLALAGLVAATAGLSVALYQARRQAAHPDRADGAGRSGGPDWRPVWRLLGGLGALVVVTATGLAVASGSSRREATMVVVGDTLDPAARSAFDRLYPVPSPPAVVLGLVFLSAAVVLVVALVRRLGRMVG